MQIDASKVKWDTPEIDLNKIQWDEDDEKPGLVKDFLIPTAKAIPRTVGTAAASMTVMPIAGLSGIASGFRGLLTGQDPMTAASNEYDRMMNRANFVKTPEEAKGLENLMLPMKPFEWAGQAGGYVGRKTGIPYAEPILGTLAEGAAMLTIPKLAKLAKERYTPKTAKPEGPLQGDKVTQDVFRETFKGKEEPIDPQSVKWDSDMPVDIEVPAYERQATMLPAGQGFTLVDTQNAKPASTIKDLMASIQNRAKHLEKNDSYKGTPIYKTWEDALNKEREQLKQITGQDEIKQPGNVSPQAEIIQPRPSQAVTVQADVPSVQTVTPSPKAAAAKTPEGVIGRINQLGGIDWGIDYNSKEARQFPDMKRTQKKGGMSPDDAAQILNDEGYNVGTGDELASALQSGQARKIYNPELQDALNERDLARQEKEWIENKLADEGITLYSNPIPQILKKYTQYIGEPIWDIVVNRTVPKVLESIGRPGQAVLRAFDTEYRGNLEGGGSFNEMVKMQKDKAAIGRDYAIDLGNRLQSYTESDQLALGEFVRGETESLPKHLEKIGSETKDILAELGKQAVETGLLSEETFFKNVGKYMPRLYESKEYQGMLNRYGIVKPDRLDLSRFQRRKDIPKELREQMGEILTPGYPVAKGIVQITHDISLARMFNDIAANPKWASTEPVEGWTQLTKSKKLGKLSEQYVHPEIEREINYIQERTPEWQKTINKAYGAWKYGKVILSPKTHVRNMMSNSTLAHLGGMPLWEQPYYIAGAIREMATDGPAYQLARRDTNIFRTGWSTNEIRNLYDQTLNLKGLSADNPVETMAWLRGALAKGKEGTAKLADLYTKEEQVFKLAKMMHSMKNGMDVKAAAADANKWLFDYGDVTHAQEKYRQSLLGAPFATFTLKALPRVAEAWIKTPWRFAAPFAMIYALEESARKYFGDTEDEAKGKRKLLPEYMQGKMFGFPSFPRIPLSDQYGREHYLDLTYILPWGDIGESGDFMGIPGAIRPLSHPLINELSQQISNHDIFWDQPIVKESEQAGLSKIGKLAASAKERGVHAAQTFLPTPAIDLNKIYSSIKGAPDYRGRERSGGVVAADVLAGIKMQPIDYAEQMEKIINKLDPEKGQLARELKAAIKTDALREAVLKKQGKDASVYTKRIEDRVEQLIGLSEELQEKFKQ
jgi:hypothetical protein